jgi:hypothetical protein
MRVTIDVSDIPGAHLCHSTRNIKCVYNVIQHRCVYQQQFCKPNQGSSVGKMREEKCSRPSVSLVGWLPHMPRERSATILFFKLTRIDARGHVQEIEKPKQMGPDVELQKAKIV